MKTLLILLLIILLCTCRSKNIKMESNSETIINIIDQRDYFRDNLIHEIGFRKDKEVKIYAVSSPIVQSKSFHYALYIYKKELGEVGKFVFWGHYKYDKTAYSWANDSILHFRLFNSKNNLSDNYTFKINKDSESLGMDSN